MGTKINSLISDIYADVGASEVQQSVNGWLDTGFRPLNKIISGSYDKGFPVGRITEISGMESTGKTLLATMGLVSTQRQGGLAVFNDHEFSFDIHFAKQLGLTDDPNHWILWHPETAEDSFAAIRSVCKHVRDNGFDKPVTIVVDSLAAMVTKAQMDNLGHQNMKSDNMSLAAFLSGGDGLKSLARTLHQCNVTLILLNQLRDNPGVMYGDKKTRPGGNAPKFYTSVRVDLTKKGKVKDGEDIIGEAVEAKIIKNKVGGVPFSTCQWTTGFGLGINLELSHINALDSMGRLGGSKGWVEFDGKKWRAKDLVNTMAADPSMYEKALAQFKD